MKCHILIALSTVYPQVGKYVFLNHFVTFLSVYCFSITSLQLCCSISDGFYLFFSLRRTCHPGGRDILMMHCLSFSEKRLLLITIFLESEKIFRLFICTFFSFFCSRVNPFLGCKIAQGWLRQFLQRTWCFAEEQKAEGTDNWQRLFLFILHQVFLGSSEIIVHTSEGGYPEIWFWLPVIL